MTNLERRLHIWTAGNIIYVTVLFQTFFMERNNDFPTSPTQLLIYFFSLSTADTPKHPGYTVTKQTQKLGGLQKNTGAGPV